MGKRICKAAIIGFLVTFMVLSLLAPMMQVVRAASPYEISIHYDVPVVEAGIDYELPLEFTITQDGRVIPPVFDIKANVDVYLDDLLSYTTELPINNDDVYTSSIVLKSNSDTKSIKLVFKIELPQSVIQQTVTLNAYPKIYTAWSVNGKSDCSGITSVSAIVKTNVKETLQYQLKSSTGLVDVPVVNGRIEFKINNPDDSYTLVLKNTNSTSLNKDIEIIAKPQNCDVKETVPPVILTYDDFSLRQDEYVIKIGDSLKVEFLNTAIDAGQLQSYPGDFLIADVVDGYLVGYNIGETDIVLTTGVQQVQLKVKVLDGSLEQTITDGVLDETIKLLVGDTYDMRALESLYVQDDISWFSSNEDIIKIEGDNIVALSVGQIQVMTKVGSDVIKVNVDVMDNQQKTFVDNLSQQDKQSLLVGGIVGIFALIGVPLYIIFIIIREALKKNAYKNYVKRNRRS